MSDEWSRGFDFSISMKVADDLLLEGFELLAGLPPQSQYEDANISCISF